jgi:hypothetical protein
MLKRIFETKRDVVPGEWRKIRNKELSDMFSSLNIVPMIKLIRMRWTGHVACIGRGEARTEF